jgi:hypothetical protein
MRIILLTTNVQKVNKNCVLSFFILVLVVFYFLSKNKNIVFLFPVNGDVLQQQWSKISFNISMLCKVSRSEILFLCVCQFRNACTKSGTLRFSQFSGCWLILSVYILMSLTFPLEDCSEFGDFVITLIYYVPKQYINFSMYWLSTKLNVLFQYLRFY